MYIAMPLDCNFSFSMRVVRLQRKLTISKAKHAIGLKLAGGLALGYLSKIYQTRFSQYARFSP